MRFQIRYRPDTPLGQRFPTTTYPWRGPGYDSREAAEVVRRACANAESMEVVEVDDAS